jgi:hypothetical protein
MMDSDQIRGLISADSSAIIVTAMSGPNLPFARQINAATQLARAAIPASRSNLLDETPFRKRCAISLQ